MPSKNIAKRPNGQWRARYRDEAGKEHARHFDRRVDAQRWLDEVTASVITGAYVDPKAGRITFSSWYLEWSSRQVWAPMTEVQNELIGRKVTFGAVPLAQLRESHLQSWVKQMQADGLAPTTINTRMMSVRACLRAAVRDRRMSADPSVGVVLPRRPRREQLMEVATSEQLSRLFAETEPQWRAYLGLGAFAGLRLGEISGIQVDDIDFLKRRIKVDRQVQKRRGGPAEIRAPKYDSNRTVFVSDPLLQLLSMHLEQFGTSSGGWLFSAQSGRPVAPTTVNAWWVRTNRRAGVEGLTLHSLRHYFASGLIAAGCDVVTVQRALGHKSAGVTLNTYSHMWPTAEDRTRQASAEMAAEVLQIPVADSLRTGSGK